MENNMKAIGKMDKNMALEFIDQVNKYWKDNGIEDNLKRNLNE
jgi:hypothetical protein